MERDSASRSFALWQLWSFVLAQALAVWLLSLFIGGFNPWPYFVGGSIGAGVASFFVTDFKRRRFLEWHEKRWKRQRERDEGPDFRRFP